MTKPVLDQNSLIIGAPGPIFYLRVLRLCIMSIHYKLYIDNLHRKSLSIIMDIITGIVMDMDIVTGIAIDIIMDIVKNIIWVNLMYNIIL